MGNGFYADLSSFDDFTSVHDLSLYAPAPDDWAIVLADIRGSTKAINEGRYKDVNMIGAACITAVLNVLDGIDIPYVFGGDGATLLVPIETLSDVRQALVKTRNLALSGFGLDLRVGAVPLPAIREAGVDLLVAKMRLSPGNFLAMFNGGGSALADDLIKSDDGSQGFLFPNSDLDDDPNLEGLSCRWELLESQRGVMFSVLIKPLGKDRSARAEIIRTVLSRLNDALGYDIQNNRPVRAENMKFTWPPSGLMAEARATKGQGPGVKRRVMAILIQSLIQWVLEKLDLAAGGYDAPLYRKELRQNSDYRRFDDTLRLVLDCPESDVSKIASVLKELRHEGGIAYGTHQADSALMTCLLFNLSEGEHVHFIDGADGGFAMAAVELKEQLRDQPDPS